MKNAFPERTLPAVFCAGAVAAVLLGILGCGNSRPTEPPLPAIEYFSFKSDPGVAPNVSAMWNTDSTFKTYAMLGSESAGGVFTELVRVDHPEYTVMLTNTLSLFASGGTKYFKIRGISESGSTKDSAAVIMEYANIFYINPDKHRMEEPALLSNYWSNWNNGVMQPGGDPTGGSIAIVMNNAYAVGIFGAAFNFSSRPVSSGIAHCSFTYWYTNGRVDFILIGGGKTNCYIRIETCVDTNTNTYAIVNALDHASSTSNIASNTSALTGFHTIDVTYNFSSQILKYSFDGADKGQYPFYTNTIASFDRIDVLTTNYTRVYIDELKVWTE
ncbi:MAG: hypothetical protein HZC28_05520 [Spirochaetes bacterium]|nr:hypothetical protein [Spirochaetota bacterium]